MIERSVSPAFAAPQTVAGRYRIERELARGAMGAVYRAVDLVYGRSIALKRSLSNDRKYLGMFEREYHTLLGLKHPRIIEVFDYGVDEHGAYYTMELLEGSDLSALAPLDYRIAASYLRDIASSLGLLHARRLLHRDLSPRNVFASGEGRCKLIDFGALSGFGVPDLVVGTPPFLPPESLHRVALDQRADLYALGALAYTLLTGRSAYPARALAELPQLWRNTPAKPSEVVAALNRPALAPVPPDLDELVMSLLTLDPLGRPASAAEVIDRLTRIAELARDEEAGDASRSYLLGVPAVGRTRELVRLRKKLRQTVEGHGAYVVVEARAGLGSTRLLSDLAVEAQLAGALPLVVDAAARGGPNGAVHELIDRLLTTARDHALAATAGHEALLARFSPALRAALSIAPDATDFSLTPSELRQRVLAALADWISKLAARRPLVLAVDDAHHLDDASAAFFAGLASHPEEHRLLLVVSLNPDRKHAAAPAVGALREGGTRIGLRPLAREDVYALVRSWFGDVEQSAELAELLHRVSGGNPRTCTELAEHLVRNRVVRDIQGAWVLPHGLSATELPSSVGELQAARIAGLEATDRRVAEALAVHRGRMPLRLCVEIAKREDPERPFERIEALTRENVLISLGDTYAFSVDALREALVAPLPEARRRELHRAMGAWIAGANGGDIVSRLDAGWHLLHGGEVERGAKLLAEAGLQLGYSNDDLASAAPALRAALDVYRGQRHDDYDRVPLLGMLALAGFFADRRLALEFGPETIATFERVLGLNLQRRLARWLGRRPALFLAIGISAVRYMLRHRRGVSAFRELITQFVSCATALAATCAVCLDPEGARVWAEKLEPLRRFLGEDSAPAYAHRFAMLLAGAPHERVSETIEEALRLRTRLEDPRPIREATAAARAALYSGVLRVLGMMDLFCIKSSTLALAQQLEQTGSRENLAIADQLRMSYHALRGEIGPAEVYRKKVELHAVSAGRIWQNEVWSPSFLILVYTSTLDTIGLKHLAERLDRQAEEIPSIRFNATMVRAEYHHAKGDHEQAFALSEPVLERTVDREFIGRSNAIATHCRGLNRLGRHEEAKALLLPLIARLSEDDKRVAALYVNLYRELAQAHAGAGDFAQAFRVLREPLEHYADSSHPLVLGNLHSTAASIALAAGDPATATEHAREMERWFRSTHNPVLIAQTEKMMRRLRAKAGPALIRGKDQGSSEAMEAQTAAAWQSSLSQISQQRNLERRAAVALRVALDQVRASNGYLFAIEAGEPVLVAPRHGDEPTEALLERVRGLLKSSTTVVDPMQPANDQQGRAPAAGSTTEVGFALYPLESDDDRVLGVFAAGLADEHALQRPRANFLTALARAAFQDPETQRGERSVG